MQKQVSKSNSMTLECIELIAAGIEAGGCGDFCGRAADRDPLHSALFQNLHRDPAPGGCVAGLVQLHDWGDDKLAHLRPQLRLTLDEWKVDQCT